MAPDSGRAPNLVVGSGRQGRQSAKIRGDPLATRFRSMSNKVPTPIRLIQLGGALGIAFWIATIGRAVSEGSGNVLGVVLIGVILGAAHVVIGLGSERRSKAVAYAIAFVFFGDLALALFVDPLAFVLVGVTVVLAVLASLPTSRSWLYGAPQG